MTYIQSRFILGLTIGICSEVTIVKASDMRPGMAFIMDGQLCVCTVATHVTPGNLRAFVQAKLRRLSDGTMIEKRLRSTEEVEQAFLDRRDMEYLRQGRVRLHGQ
jgi:elongation factor P